MLALVLILYMIFFSKKEKSALKVLWCFVFATNPYVGLVLYLIFGSTIVSSRLERRSKKRLYDRGYTELPGRVNGTSFENEESGLSDISRDIAKFTYNYCHVPMSAYETEKIFTTGSSHYQQLFQDIRSAEHSVCILFYEIENDYIAREFMDLLTEKAASGVPVFLMTDYLTGVGYFGRMARKLRKSGGEVIRVQPYLTHYRNHRKIVVIDHKTAYIGGMNIGKRFQNEDKVKTPWRDTQIRLTGCAVADLEAYFLMDWFCNIPRKWMDREEHVADDYFAAGVGSGNEPCQFVTGGPTSKKESIRMVYLTMIRSARESIRIQSPYFVPDETILDALRTAASSGVSVEIMVPGVSSSFFLTPVTTYYCDEMLRCGAKIYRYNGYIHAKTITVDGKVCSIGSANMDYRSLFLDDEVIGLFYDCPVVQEYEQIYSEDITYCTTADPEEYRGRSGHWRRKTAFYRRFEYLL